MKISYRYSCVLFALLLIIVMSLAGSALASDKVVIINSNEWQDRYLASIYAGYLDADILYFDNLANAELVTSLSAGRDVIVIESNDNYVVAKYENHLKSNGFDNVEVIYFDDYSDLQFTLWGDIPNGKYLLLDPDFGIEAVAGAPLAVNDNFYPYFLTDENYVKIASLLKSASDSDVIVAGHFPIRFVENLPGEKFLDSTIENTWELTKKSVSSSRGDWGVLMSINEVDLTVLANGLPIFVYYGDIVRVSDEISNTYIKGLNVIGGGLTDISREIKTRSGKPLSLMVKYAKTLTNYPGSEGKLLEIDTVIMPFPFYSMVILGVEYFNNEGILSVRYHNNGFLPVNFQSRIDFAGKVIESSEKHALLPGDSVDIPFEIIDAFGDLSKVTITTSYGQDLILDKKIKDTFGRDVISYDVEINEFQYEDKPEIKVINVRFDNDKGIFYITVKNPNDYDLNIHSEMMFDDIVIPSKMTNIGAGEEFEIEIPVEYFKSEDFDDKEVMLTFVYGKDDTLFIESMKLSDVGRENVFSEALNDKNRQGSISLFVIIVVSILLFWFIRSRKKKKEEI